MAVSAHDTGLFHALLGEVALEQGLVTVAVLVREVGNDEVARENDVGVVVVQGLDGTGTFVIAEFAEDAEITVVFGVTAGSEDIVGRIVEDHQLRNEDPAALAGSHIVREGSVHIGPGRLRVGVRLEEVAVADDTLLGDIQEFLAGCGSQRKDEEYRDDNLFHGRRHFRKSG